MISTTTALGRRVSVVSVAFLATALMLSGCTSSAPAGTATSTPAPSSSAPATVSPSPTPAGPTAGVVAAATEFLARLNAEQRDRVMYDAADPALQQWSYFPSTNDRNGVALGELTEEQRGHALSVAEAVLSASGYEQVLGVLAAEDALGVRNGEEATVNAGRIFIAFFGATLIGPMIRVVPSTRTVASPDQSTPRIRRAGALVGLCADLGLDLSQSSVCFPAASIDGCDVG